MVKYRKAKKAKKTVKKQAQRRIRKVLPTPLDIADNAYAGAVETLDELWEEDNN